jgi:hypothetical protein
MIAKRHSADQPLPVAYGTLVLPIGRNTSTSRSKLSFSGRVGIIDPMSVIGLSRVGMPGGFRKFQVLFEPPISLICEAQG